MNIFSIKCIFIIVMTDCFSVTYADEALKWLTSKEVLKSIPIQKVTNIPLENIYEVVSSRRSAAINNGVSKKPIMPISIDIAKWLTGHYYKVPDNKKPYLVRFVYGDNKLLDGSYVVNRVNNSLFVGYTSFGNTSSLQKSAFVINLEFKPENLYLVHGEYKSKESKGLPISQPLSIGNTKPSHFFVLFLLVSSCQTFF